MDYERYEELKHQCKHMEQKALDCVDDDLVSYEKYMVCVEMIKQQMKDVMHD